MATTSFQPTITDRIPLSTQPKPFMSVRADDFIFPFKVYESAKGAFVSLATFNKLIHELSTHHYDLLSTVETSQQMVSEITDTSTIVLDDMHKAFHQTNRIARKENDMLLTAFKVVLVVAALLLLATIGLAVALAIIL